MTFDEAIAKLAIEQDPIPTGASNRPGTPIAPKFVTIHNTDNESPGADARAHGRYQRSADARARKVSWHFTVDDVRVVQSLPTTEMGWHAGSGAGNASSIGVEICMNKGLDEAAAYDRAALLAAWLCRTHGLIVPDALKQHHDWSGKDCPRVLRARRGGWANFCTAATAHYDALRRDKATPAAISKTAMRSRGDVPSQSVVPASRMSAKPVPTGDPVPFAAGNSGPQCFWPLITSHPMALVVSGETASGTPLGMPGRRFLAMRNNGARCHVGLDLFANEGDEVVACEDGNIVAFYRFYQVQGTGEWSCALLAEHGGFVINYGEVKENSLTAYGRKLGDSVRAGDKIGRVSGTAMVHFETYVKGTRQNLRWMTGQKRPAALLNPTQYLLDLAAGAVRISVHGAAVASEPKPAKAAAPAVPAGGALVQPAKAPVPGSGDWTSRHGGREWRYDQRGVYTHDVNDGKLPWRSPGAPVTVRRIWSLMGEPIIAFGTKHGINPALILMTIATETGNSEASGFTGPPTFRWEPAVANSDVKPQFFGSYSAGPTQTLATTARETIALFGRKWKLDYDPLDVAPALKAQPHPPPDRMRLYDYAVSVDLGCAEIRRRWQTTGDNPILVAAAYNAGGIYPTKPGSATTAWRIKVAGDHLDRAAKWYGDACAVLAEVGVL